ncbi:MAG TPA: pirin family protein [Usitatibacter sp.]|nr:pirin family protein [Usitatibacter sp.]
MDIQIDRIRRADPPAGKSSSHRARLVVPPGDFEAMSPFLLMAEDWFAPPGGFPEHPHRGMQTVTIVLEGGLEHRDHTGAHGVIGAGDIQWMTAGRGVVHSEMPAPSGVHSLQLWLNLPASRKMSDASYRDQRGADTPVKKGPGYEVRVYAGRHEEVEHPHGSVWPLMLLDVRMSGEKRVELVVPPGFRAFLYVISGSARIEGDDTAVKDEDVVWFKPVASDAEEKTVLGLEADIELHALLFAAPVIDEPVAAHGPFVMNTMDEVRRAYADYQGGRFVEPPRPSA